MKKDNDTFVRYGGLSLVKQKGYSRVAKTYHSPPAKKGIYAFPIKAIDFFLCSHRKKFELQRREFKHKGNIWHHLGFRCKPNEILAMHGSWVMTEFKVWEKAFSKESLNLRYGEKKKDSGWDLSTNNINQPLRSGIRGIYSADHLEIFISEKIG
jgi:hypothetical protein